MHAFCLLPVTLDPVLLENNTEMFMNRSGTRNQCPAKMGIVQDALVLENAPFCFQACLWKESCFLMRSPLITSYLSKECSPRHTRSWKIPFLILHGLSVRAQSWKSLAVVVTDLLSEGLFVKYHGLLLSCVFSKGQEAVCPHSL